MIDHSQLVFKSDSLRLKWDIRLRPEKELASYQKTQLRQIRQQIKEYQETELSHAIRRTVDGTLLEEIEDYCYEPDRLSIGVME